MAKHAQQELDNDLPWIKLTVFDATQACERYSPHRRARNLTVSVPPISCQSTGCPPGDSVARARELATELNRTCFCITLDRHALANAMQAVAAVPDFYATHIVSRPHLFANVPVFLPEADRDAMLAVVLAIETTARLPAYVDTVLKWAPDIALRDFGPAGALMGYDFHLGSEAPRLIEINTNAGGAFLNAFSARAQLACCDIVEPLKTGTTVEGFDEAVVTMFESEWRRQRGAGRPKTIAIIDDAPTEQYLYPDFLLARQMLEARGVSTLIADPAELSYVGGALRAGETAVDLVYNRLVDFSLTEERHRTLREAYLDGAVVVTPNPRVHALFADKRNLALLSDLEQLRKWAVAAEAIQTLASIPKAIRVTHDNAQQLWSERKGLFFKPVAGHGGKAVYRGDKLTKTVWSEILSAEYIAQDIAPPSERVVKIGDAMLPRKIDVRLYTYEGKILLAAARLYQGQTTNFRTEGGGFAPVHFL